MYRKVQWSRRGSELTGVTRGGKRGHVAGDGVGQRLDARGFSVTELNKLWAV